MISCDKIEIGGFSGPIRTNNGVDISFDDLETYVIDCSKFSEFFCNLLRL